MVGNVEGVAGSGSDGSGGLAVWPPLKLQITVKKYFSFFVCLFPFISFYSTHESSWIHEDGLVVY